MTYKKIVLQKRPAGAPAVTDFAVVENDLPTLAEEEVLVKTLYLSIDPFLRNMMNEADFVGPSVPLGGVFGVLAAGEVLSSRSSAYREGDYVSGGWGWQTHAAVHAGRLTKVNPELGPVSTSLGLFGISGLTAYFGMIEIGKPKPGETVVVSGAAGAVGMIAGQIAKLYGAKVIGIAGSDEKNAYLKKELGFDETINYRTSPDLIAAVRQAAPEGVDVYFDNVGGAVSDAVIGYINPGARIPICGQISQYHSSTPESGPRVGMQLVKNNALMQGFAFTQYESRFPEALDLLSRWYKENKVKLEEHIIDGFENAPKAFVDLFRGKNIGKFLVKA
ncbi:NADP-dependent oxidoreductase [Paenibacillus sp.]|uniref:NADP-dependent oxidoreductase n=1 Tax=Paenibacillus sp. TaxID=58172 RepID=UPI00281112D1|nr:NADP-dependent oxidoreductase [Paenibacillus sp.]